VPKQFMSSFEVSKSRESEYYMKMNNRGELPLIREEQLIRIESVADDPSGRGENFGVKNCNVGGNLRNSK
jgi:hypothetical protein